ncbi:MAG: hypothetical protein KME08_02935 [Aphanothece sp. CMT-3BRIN-NPC111]|nr:hypothetical protein [Aphanothece sp. CMT-3BRIN-NPC111]
MRVWITSFLVLFGMAELYQWMKDFTLPFPMYILGGTFLAIASNYDRRAGFPFGGLGSQLQIRDHPQPPVAIDPPGNSPIAHSPSTPLPQPSQAISFTIPRPNERSQ